MGPETDSAAKFFDRFAKTWASNDGQALGNFFSVDASLINPFGQRADGREAIAAMYSNYFSGMLAGTSTTLELGTTRPVGDSHVFADAEQTISAGDGTLILAVHLVALLRRDGEQWQLVDVRPYTLTSLPV
jgi:uncharacterized protein (TIGR02246 family)